MDSESRISSEDEQLVHEAIENHAAGVDAFGLTESPDDHLLRQDDKVGKAGRNTGETILIGWPPF